MKEMLEFSAAHECFPQVRTRLHSADVNCECHGVHALFACVCVCVCVSRCVARTRADAELFVFQIICREQVEIIPLDAANEGFKRIESNAARYRMVLKIEGFREAVTKL
jgi:hypothetical protein